MPVHTTLNLSSTLVHAGGLDAHFAWASQFCRVYLVPPVPLSTFASLSSCSMCLITLQALLLDRPMVALVVVSDLYRKHPGVHVFAFLPEAF